MRASLHAALRLLARWELWVLVGGWVISGIALRLLREAVGETGTPILGSISGLDLLSIAMAGGWLGVSMVLLFPLVRGRRGLDLAFLSGQPTTVLAGAAIAGGTWLAIPLLPYWMAGTFGSAEWYFRVIIGLVWVLNDAAVLLCAWYVHGKGVEASGRRPPGPWVSAWKGLVTGALGLWLPGYLLHSLHMAMSPKESYGVWFAYLMARGAVILVFGAWFMGALGEGEPEEGKA